MQNIKSIQIIMQIDDGTFKEVEILNKDLTIKHVINFFGDNLVFKSDKKIIPIQSIIHMACEFFCLDDICRKSRKREYVDARFCAMYYLTTNTKNSLKSIGNAFGGRDHSSVIHGRDTFINLMETDALYSKMYVDFCNFVSQKN